MRLFISSRASLTAKEALAAVRSHWQVENKVHWTLDVAFREDESRLRAENAAENLAVVRHTALNLLRSVKGSKVGIKNRRLEAGWSEGVPHESARGLWKLDAIALRSNRACTDQPPNEPLQRTRHPATLGALAAERLLCCTDSW